MCDTQVRYCQWSSLCKESLTYDFILQYFHWNAQVTTTALLRTWPALRSAGQMYVLTWKVIIIVIIVSLWWPHPGAGLVTGVVPHMHPRPVHPLLVLYAVCRALSSWLILDSQDGTDHHYLGHQAPGGEHTLPDEGLQLGALADGGVVK